MHSQTRNKVPWMSGLVYGLQNRLRRFESARHLLLKDDEQILFIIFFLALILSRLAPCLLCFPISIKNVLPDNTSLSSLRTGSCCPGGQGRVTEGDKGVSPSVTRTCCREGVYSISTTVMPAPPKRTSSSRADLTWGTLRRYWRMSWRRMPLPVPCRMRMRDAPTSMASSM